MWLDRIVANAWPGSETVLRYHCGGPEQVLARETPKRRFSLPPEWRAGTSRTAPNPRVVAGNACDRVEQVVPRAVEEGQSVLESAERWYSGAYLLETVPCVLHILALHGGDAEEAVVRAANDTRDNDTIAAVVGAAVGALHGVRALPTRWLHALLGRTLESDDGRVQTLVEEAVGAFAS